MALVPDAIIRNRLLAGLSADSLEQLGTMLEPVDLDLKQILYRVGGPISTVHFLEAGIVSLLAPLDDGHMIEVGIVGREGLVGVPLVLGAGQSSTEAMVQMAGTALRLDAKCFTAAFDESAPLRRVLLRYVQAFHSQVSQTAACNARHPLEQRLARWLLMAHDRAEANQFPMTQEFMATMLGVRRVGVTVAVGVLQRAGLIHWTHGRIAIVDRTHLEQVACECYGIVRQEFAQLLDTTSPSS